MFISVRRIDRALEVAKKCCSCRIYKNCKIAEKIDASIVWYESSMGYFTQNVALVPLALSRRSPTREGKYQPQVCKLRFVKV